MNGYGYGVMIICEKITRYAEGWRGEIDQIDTQGIYII